MGEEDSTTGHPDLGSAISDQGSTLYFGLSDRVCGREPRGRAGGQRAAPVPDPLILDEHVPRPGLPSPNSTSHIEQFMALSR